MAFRAAIFILSLSFFVAGNQIYASNADPLEPVSVTTGEWPPYVTEIDGPSGLATDLVRDTLRGMGKEPQFVFAPFFNVLNLTSQSGVTGSFPWFVTSERQHKFIYSDPLMDIEHAIFFNPLNQPTLADATDITALAGLRTARVDGYDYGETGNQLVSDATAVPSDLAALHLLSVGSIDYLIVAVAVGEALIDRYFFDRPDAFAVISGLQYSLPIHFIVPRDAPGAEAFIRDFNVNLARMRGAFPNAVERSLASRLARETRIVNLTGIGNFPLVTAKDDPSDSNSYILPRGTRAIIMDWSANFLAPEDTQIYDQMFLWSRVKILDGPLKGRQAWVQNIYIELP